MNVSLLVCPLKGVVILQTQTTCLNRWFLLIQSVEQIGSLNSGKFDWDSHEHTTQKDNNRINRWAWKSGVTDEETADYFLMAQINVTIDIAKYVHPHTLHRQQLDIS